VLYYTSDFFEKKIENGDTEFVVSKDENISNFKDIIKFLYTGCLDCSESSQIISFLLLSKTVKLF
jgi:hypothetical protein